MAGFVGFIGKKVIEEFGAARCRKIISYRVESRGKADVAATQGRSFR